MGLKPWDTVKPLGKWFRKMHRVVLLDDDRFKAVPGEEDNMIVVPCWENEDPEDRLLTHLVDALAKELTQLSTDADVRKCTKAVESVLMGVTRGMKPGKDDDSGYADAQDSSVIANGSPGIIEEKRTAEQQRAQSSKEPPLDPSSPEQPREYSNVVPFPGRPSKVEEKPATKPRRKRRRKR